MTGFFLLLAAIVLVLAIVAVLLGRLSDGEDREKSSINPIWLLFAAVTGHQRLEPGIFRDNFAATPCLYAFSCATI